MKTIKEFKTWNEDKQEYVVCLLKEDVLKLIEEINKRKNKIWINIDGDMYEVGSSNPNITEGNGVTNDTWEEVIFVKELKARIEG